MHVTVYTKPGCHLCDEVLLMLDKMTPRYAIELTEVNIIEDVTTYEQYKYLIPVVEITGADVGRISAPITESQLKSYLERARKALNTAQSDRVAKWPGKHSVPVMPLADGSLA